MRHWLTTRLTDVSLAIFLIALAAWIHGYFAFDCTGWHRVRWTADNHFVRTRCMIASSGGQFIVGATHTDWDWSILLSPTRPKPLTAASQAVVDTTRAECPDMNTMLTYSMPHESGGSISDLFESLLGFNKVLTPGSGGMVAFPAWLPTLVFAILPLRRLDQRRRRKSAAGSIVASLAAMAQRTWPMPPARA